jgi:endogenous inhibitor of DNA gyrase (YacG/DUF329 family)
MDQQRLCLACSTPFEVPASSRRKYCSVACHPHQGHSRSKRPPVTVGCDRCGKEFQRKAWEVEQRRSKGWALYCSTECRDAVKKGRKGEQRVVMVTLTCPKCGKEFQVKPHEQRRRRYCSRECARWTGGRRPVPERTLTVEGYVSVYLPLAERPLGQERYSRFAEHRVVMSRTLGRWLKPNEVVHHINGDRADNRPENLQLRTIQTHGHGQVLRCRACGSDDIEHVEF